MKSCEDLYEDVRSSMEFGNYKKATDQLETLVGAYPDFAQGHFDLGALYLKAGEKQKALEAYKLACDLDPKNATYLKSLADYYYTEKNDIQSAKMLYARVLDEDPQHAQSLQILGNLAVVERDFETAKTYFERVLDIEPWNHEASLIFEKLEQFEYRQESDRDGDAAYDKSQRLVQAGKTDEAIKTLEALIHKQPDYALAHNDLGVLYYQKGEKEKALGFYEAAVRLAPENSIFQKNLADMYFIEFNRIKDALGIYFQLLQKDPTDIETLMAAGYISKAVNRIDDAVIFFERVLDLEPWNMEVSEILNELSPMQIDLI